LSYTRVAMPPSPIPFPGEGIVPQSLYGDLGIPRYARDRRALRHGVLRCAHYSLAPLVSYTRFVLSTVLPLYHCALRRLAIRLRGW
jgi:hypothetical protein